MQVEPSRTLMACLGRRGAKTGQSKLVFLPAAAYPKSVFYEINLSDSCACASLGNGLCFDRIAKRVLDR
jgi:hypothetical protein